MIGRQAGFSIIFLMAFALCAEDASATMVPITPCRVLDSRLDPGSPIASGVDHTLTVRRECGIPDTATAINFNATVVSPPGPGFVTLYPGGATRPTASSLNFKSGEVSGNAGYVGLNPDASGGDDVGIYIATNPAGLAAHLVLDITGYQAGSLTELASALTGAGNAPERWLDVGGGTVIDRVTGLQWERKTDDNSDRDKDNTYSWSASGQDPDGTLFGFITTLNTPPCLGGMCDWRVPTVHELRSLLEANAPGCAFGPCSTILGEIHSPEDVWTITEDPAGFGDDVYVVDFDGPSSYGDGKITFHGARAVRGGVPTP